MKNSEDSFFKEVMLVSTKYVPKVGSFARAKKVVDEKHNIMHWYYCRDVFHSLLYNLKIFFFCSGKHNGKSVASFIDKIETKLKIFPRSQIGPTQKKSIIWIKPSAWWHKYAMRRSLFTILLRAGIHYSAKKDNVEACIKSEKYLDQTSYAFKRFLKGYTKYTGFKRGWYRQFYLMSPTRKQVNELLAKPSK